VSVEDSAGDQAFAEALETLRRRGYLGRRAPGAPRGEQAAAGALSAAGLALVLMGLVLAAVLPPRPMAVLTTLALLAPVYVIGLAVAWLAGNLAEGVHRRGLPAGLAAAGTGAGGAMLALGLAYLAGRPWTPPFGPGVLAGSVLAGLGGVLIVRGLARTVVLKILRRPLRTAMLPPRLWRVTVLTLAVVVAGATLALFLGRPRPGGAGSGEALRVRPGPERLAVLALDGASLQEVELLAQRRPDLAGMMGWRRAILAEDDPAASLPVRWITVATGISPERRGVATFRQVAVGNGGPVLLLPPLLRRVVAGIWSPLGVVEEQTVPAAHRKAPTIWEMASRAGLPVRVLGWWGSFPPRRVRGVVASERWLLTGDRSPETVFPTGLEAGLGARGGTAPLDMDHRVLASVGGAGLDDASLVMAYLPGWWLERRRVEDGGAPLLAARALEPHLQILGEVLARLLAHGFAVCVVGMAPGRAWVLWSAEGPKLPAVSAGDLVDTWLDALGLPPAAGLEGRVRRDLSGLKEGRVPPPARYGPPPPLAGAAPAGEGAAQLELLRSLGYLN